jgi:4-alpha-glucanotransferase
MAKVSGILLHPTSLPGGDLSQAFKWLDFLHDSKQHVWQVLPLCPTGYGGCPYNGLSAFAGNPKLISPDNLAGYQSKKEDFEEFCSKQAAWLDDFALFSAIDKQQGHVIWTKWPKGLAERDKAALADFRSGFAREIEAAKFSQFVFHGQWDDLHNHAKRKGIRIIGDAPLYVGHHSADVWARRELFCLDKNGNPTLKAGFPPDQSWGNPIYRWDEMRRTGYGWWIERFRHMLGMVDQIRIDHFCGLATYWEIPANANASQGRWADGPRSDLFNALKKGLGHVPFVAEDLGALTPEVCHLRDQFGIPGMRVMHFGFDGNPDNFYLPHKYPENCVAYTGTHDNDTTRGWYDKTPSDRRDAVRRYLRCSDHDVTWAMIAALQYSAANTAIVPMQDVLDLGSHARMNVPGRADGNWGWRMDCVPPKPNGRLVDLAYKTGRA